MRKVFFLSSVIMLFGVLNASAQKRSSSFSSENYVTAIGVKVYPASGGAAVTLKHFINKGAALEALGSFWERGGRITGLYEFHWDIPGAPGLKWYVGPGVHLGFYNDNYKYNNTYRSSYLALGVDGVIGLDYKFSKIPLNLSADWQPSFDFGSNRQGFYGDFGGIAARYTF
jgi:hypothetical protein